MFNLQTVYAVAGKLGNTSRVYYYDSADTRDRAKQTLDQAGVETRAINYAPGELLKDNCGDIANITFGNAALLRGPKPGRYGS